MTRAAKELSISQPALSRSIARLEDQLGAKLFDRHGRSVKLNKYGSMFFHRVDNMIGEYSQGQREIQELIAPEQGVISLGFLHTLGITRIPKIIAGFRKQYPQIRFQLQQGHSYSLLEQLKKGDMDLCLLASVSNTDQSIRWQHLWSEELFLYVAANHPLTSKKEATLEEIANEAFIMLKAGYALRYTVDDMFQQVQLTPDVIFEGEEVATVAGFVAEGLGISILPDLEGLDQSNLSKLSLKNVRSERSIGISWTPGRFISPAVQKFQAYMLDTYRENG